jgi:Uma2 family endonuclease
MRNPDAAWILSSRWNALSEEEQDSFSPLCPDFVIELRSPSDRLPEMREKMAMWVANGAQVAWLIDPKRRAVEIYRPGEAPEVHKNPVSVRGSGPVQGFELMLGRVWD